jgi:hypothetical protein
MTILDIAEHDNKSSELRHTQPNRLTFKDCIAIGHFDEDNEQDTPNRIQKTATGWMRRIPDGVGVQTARYVRDARRGEFSVVVTPVNSEAQGTEEVQGKRLSRTSSSNYIYSELTKEPGFGNFFLSHCRYHYLKAWLDLLRFTAPCSQPKLIVRGRAL